MKLLAGIAMSFQRQKSRREHRRRRDQFGGDDSESSSPHGPRALAGAAGDAASTSGPQKNESYAHKLNLLRNPRLYRPISEAIADDHLRRFIVAITNDRTQTIFALHESAFGTKRTCPSCRSMSAFGDKADMMCSS